MSLENKENHLSSCTFSAFWEVNNNPKDTFKRGHIKHAKQKDLNFFISEHGSKVSNGQDILLSKNNLPSLAYIGNLKKFCHSNPVPGRKTSLVNLKSGLKLEGKVFFNLAKIWTSKILLFREVLNCTNSFNSIIWRDCVVNINFDLIKECSINNKIIINKYDNDRIWRNPFGNLLSIESMRQLRQWDNRISACVIRIPFNLVNDMCDLYIQCLKYIDSTFEIYDEEIVLTFMCDKYPELFHIINS